MTHDARRPRLAASSYLNTAPLIWSWQQSSEVELVLDRAPATSAEALRQARVDAALVPVIAYQNLADALLIPRVCIASQTAVRSVVLATRGKELSEVATVALDTSSRTSAALVQIIYREFLNRDIACTAAAPDINRMLDTNDAALVIGDPAMRLQNDSSHALRIYDLAELWRDFTAHGFVFAMWMTRAGFETASLSRARQLDFARTRDVGLLNSRAIINAYLDELGLPFTDLQTYLHHNIVYELNDDLLKGLKLFYRLAHRHNLIDGFRDLRFFE